MVTLCLMTSHQKLVVFLCQGTRQDLAPSSLLRALPCCLWPILIRQQNSIMTFRDEYKSTICTTTWHALCCTIKIAQRCGVINLLCWMLMSESNLLNMWKVWYYSIAKENFVASTNKQLNRNPCNQWQVKISVH